MDPIQTARTLLADVSTAEARLAASAGLVVAAGVVSWIAVPWLVRRAGRLARERVVVGPTRRATDATVEYLPVTPSARPVVRGLQAGAFGLAAIALLVVWGWTGAAVTAVLVLAASVPSALRVALTAGLFVGAYVGTGAVREYVVAPRTGAGTFRLNEHQSEVLYRVLQVTLFATAAFTALRLWNVDLSGLLLGAGFLGVVVGMAARQTLGALVSGFVLMFSQPFEVGDWVAVADREGVVTDITVVNTRLRTADGEQVVLPNDAVSRSTVTNYSHRGRLRLRVEVGVDYGVDPGRAAEVAVAAIEDVDDVLAAPLPEAVPRAFGESGVVMELRFWIDHPSARKRTRVRAEVIEAVKTALEEAGIDIPYPQREVRSREGRTALAGGTAGGGAAPDDGGDAAADGDRVASVDAADADEDGGQAVPDDGAPAGGSDGGG